MSSPEHTPNGDPCTHALPDGSICGLAPFRHRRRNRRGRADNRRGDRHTNRPCAALQPIVAIDGEGQTKDGVHRYTYLAAVDERGEVQNTSENPEGLTTKQCLEFLLTLANAGVRRVFGYSLGYDYSMMLKDLPNEKLYALTHEEARTVIVDGKKRIRPVFWAG